MIAKSFQTQSVPPSSKNLNDIENYTRSPRRPFNGRLNPPQQISTKFVLHIMMNLVNAFLIRPRGYKIFSCSTPLSMKFQLLIKTKIPTNNEVSLNLSDVVFINNNCWHFDIYEQGKFRAQLSRAGKNFNYS